MKETAKDQESLLWEKLVTDGHVRAARLRWIEPWLIGLGVVFILGGIYMLALIPPRTALYGRDEGLVSGVASVQAGAIAALADLPSVRVPPDQMKNLVPASQISQVVTSIMDGLNATGDLPADKLTMKVVDADTFWRQPWSFSHLNVTLGPNTTLVGAVVNEGTQDSPQLARWLGVFNRREDGWKAISIVAPGFYVDSTIHSTTIEQIPLTLQSVLPGAP
jgi:hypothetical protein